MGVALTAISHKLDLPRFNCDQFSVIIEMPESEPAVESIDSHLEEGFAWDSYSRSGARHLVIFRRSPDGTNSDEVASFTALWLIPTPEMPTRARRGALWGALELAYESKSEQKEMHAHCNFSMDSSIMQPKMTLPVSLFTFGSFAFNQIQGYRAAMVEGERTLWSAIVDWPEAVGDYRISIRMNDWNTEDTSREIFARCISICNDLMTGKSSG